MTQLARQHFADHGGAPRNEARAPDRFELRPEPGSSDFCSREGAHALKEKIEAYWRERGQDVTISLQNVGFHPAIRAARYDVRSDMINGMPRTHGRKAAAARPSFAAPIEEEVYLDEQFGDDIYEDA